MGIFNQSEIYVSLKKDINLEPSGQVSFSSVASISPVELAPHLGHQPHFNSVAD